MAGASVASPTKGLSSGQYPGRVPNLAASKRVPSASKTSTDDNIVSFFGSQVSNESVINYSYTDPPLRLLGYDIYNFFHYLWALPYVLLPYRPTDSGDLDELAPTKGNLFCIFIHFILVVLQLGFILILPPLALFIPLWMTILVASGFLAVNAALAALLNDRNIVFESDSEYAAHDQPKFAHEKWVFLNGVAVGKHWMKSNLNRLALTFGRPVTGIHNRTSGILFDVIECLIQRNFGYATNDIRTCYSIVKDTLYDAKYSKVVFILHSQGGIEGGMVLDWLLQELPQNLLAKLEVYTFGNAANHFNNPYRTMGNQVKGEMSPATAGAGAELPTPTAPLLKTPEVSSLTAGSTKGSPTRHNSRPPTPETPSMTVTTDPIQSPAAAAPRARRAKAARAIRHIEHYAHKTDFVALWGVLHFATTPPASASIPRFIGRLFARTSPEGRGGHQFVQHYLDGMFPLARDPLTRKFTGCDEVNNAFMNSVICTSEGGSKQQVGKGGEKGKGRGVVPSDGGGGGVVLEREGILGSWESGDEQEQEEGKEKGGDCGCNVEVQRAGNQPVLVRKGTGEEVDKVRVRELSRLWKYRNGRSPVEKPPGLARDVDGVVREATM